MEETKARVRVNYRAVSDDPARRCSDCFFFQQTPESDDGNCFGHSVNADGVCDTFTATREVDPDSTGR